MPSRLSACPIRLSPAPERAFGRAPRKGALPERWTSQRRAERRVPEGGLRRPVQAFSPPARPRRAVPKAMRVALRPRSPRRSGCEPVHRDGQASRAAGWPSSARLVPVCSATPRARGSIELRLAPLATEVAAPTRAQGSIVTGPSKSQVMSAAVVVVVVPAWLRPPALAVRSVRSTWLAPCSKDRLQLTALVSW